MAKDSWLEVLQDMLQKGGSAVGNAVSSAARGGADEISALYQGLEDDYNASPNDNQYGRMLDRASEYYTGRPISSREESLVSPDISPVKAGVSDGETAKALVNLSNAQSRAEALRNEQNVLRNARLEMLMNASKGAAEGDTYVADESGYKSGAPMPRGESRGSFTKSKKPIAEYGEQGIKGSELETLGMPKQIATLVEKLGRTKDEGKQKALELALKMIPEKTSPAQQDLAVLSSLIKSRDPIAGKEIAIAMLRRMGRSQDEIRTLFSKLDGLK